MKWEVGMRKAEGRRRRKWEVGMRKGKEFGRWKAEGRRRKGECGLRPVGAIGAYAPEGMRKRLHSDRACRRMWNSENGA
jgi:hypothetical protein